MMNPETILVIVRLYRRQLMRRRVHEVACYPNQHIHSIDRGRAQCYGFLSQIESCVLGSRFQELRDTLVFVQGIFYSNGLYSKAQLERHLKLIGDIV